MEIFLGFMVGVIMASLGIIFFMAVLMLAAAMIEELRDYIELHRYRKKYKDMLDKYENKVD